MATEEQWVDIDESEDEFVDVPSNLAVETPFTGAFPVRSQPAGAVSRGLFAGVSGEFLPALTERAGLAERFGVAEPEFTDPLTYEIARTVGSAIPVAKGAQAVKLGTESARRLGPQIAAAISRSLPTALTFGAASGAAEPVREDAGALETLGGAAVGTGLTALIAGAPPAAAAALRKGGKALVNYFSKDPAAYSKAAERLIYDTLGEVTNPLTTQKVGGFIDSGDLQVSIGTVKKMGGLPSTLREAVPSIEKTKETLFDEAKAFANKNSKYKIKNVFEGVGEELTQARRIEEALDPAGIASLRAAVKRMEGDMTLPESLEVQKELNLLSKKVLNKKELDIKSAEADPDYALIQSIRRKLSGAINDAFTGISGTDDNPYRRYGAVTQLGDFLQDRFNKLRPVKQKGLAGRIKEKGLIQGLLPEENEMKIADDAITDLFDITPEFKAPKLSQDEIKLRLERSVKTPAQVEAEAVAAQRARTAAGARELRDAEEAKKTARRAAQARERTSPTPIRDK